VYSRVPPRFADAKESAEEEDEESDTTDEDEEDDSSGWSGELLELDDAAMADYAANAALEGGAGAASLIAAMALEGEGAHRAPRKARFLDSESDDSYDDDEEEEGEEEEEEDVPLSRSAPVAGAAWAWGTGGRGGAPSTHARGAAKKLQPGEKARLRKAGIAAKREARAERAFGKGGFDARAVASALRSFIAAEGDMIALKPAGKHELALTAQLARLFGLRCSVQGGARARFAVVHATRGAEAPAEDDAQLLALLRAARAGGAVERPSGRKRPQDVQTPQARRGGGGSASKAPRSSGGGSIRHAARMSFVSGGRIGGEGEEEQAAEAEAAAEAAEAAEAQPAPARPPAANRGLRRAEAAAEKERLKLERRDGRRERDRLRERARLEEQRGGAARSAPTGGGEWGEFEKHTTGFGSKMLAKMGYARGQGLGRDGAGIADPILAVQRGKNVGLGAD